MFTTIVATFIVLGVLIFFHELGHFLAAKAVGVHVERFSIGFPPILFKKKWGETEYAIGIPYGGYVKMKGQDDFEIQPDENPDPDSFYGKPVLPRAAIISGGVVFNIILAIALFFVVSFFWGVSEPIQDVASVGIVREDMPAAELGLVKGDTIIAIDGQPVKDWLALTELVYARPEEMITVRWKHNGEVMEDSVVTASHISPETGEPIGLLGINSDTREIKIGAGRALVLSVSRVGLVFAEMAKMIGRLFTGRFNAEEVGGPVMIAKLAGQSARLGISSFLLFIGFISVNLAFINLLPLPVFDGGHLVFLLLEGIRGKRLPLKARVVIQNIGLALILILIVLVTSNDIMRLFR